MTRLQGQAEWETYHLVTLFVSSTGAWAAICSGSALAIRNVYMSEYLGSFEDIANPVPLKDFCNINMQISAITDWTLDLKKVLDKGYLGDLMLIYWNNHEARVVPEN